MLWCFPPPDKAQMVCKEIGVNIGNATKHEKQQTGYSTDFDDNRLTHSDLHFKMI